MAPKLSAQWQMCTQGGCKKASAYTKLPACKSIKATLSSTLILFKVMSYFCVWKQIVFSTMISEFIISFTWEGFVKYSYICCYVALLKITSTTLKPKLNKSKAHIKLYVILFIAWYKIFTIDYRSLWMITKIQCWFLVKLSYFQSIFTCSKLTIKTLENSVKYIQN